MVIKHISNIKNKLIWPCLVWITYSEKYLIVGFLFSCVVLGPVNTLPLILGNWFKICDNRKKSSPSDSAVTFKDEFK